MKKTELPDYTRSEEIVNSVTHAVGAALSIAMLVFAIIVASWHRNTWAVVSAAVYGASLILMFSVSGVYHGLRPNAGKRVMRVIDHCDIYMTIAGTYTPILLVGIRPLHPVLAWVVFGLEWGLAALAITLNAVDLKRFEKFSFACYLGMGWCVVMCLKATVEAMTMRGFLWLLGGGIAYTVGAALYLVGKKKRYAHSVFHIFVVIGAVTQFVSIIKYVL